MVELLGDGIEGTHEPVTPVQLTHVMPAAVTELAFREDRIDRAIASRQLLRRRRGGMKCPM